MRGRSGFGRPARRAGSTGGMGRGDGMGYAAYYDARAAPGDGVSNAPTRRSGEGVGRGRPVRRPNPTPEIDDRSWTQAVRDSPQAEYGPMPGRGVPDTPINGPQWHESATDPAVRARMRQQAAAAAAAGQNPLLNGEWPTDDWGAPLPAGDVMGGLDPKVLEALIQAGQAAGQIAVTVTPEIVASRRARMEAEAAQAKARHEGRRQKAEEAATVRASAEAQREAHRAAAVQTKARSNTAGLVMIGLAVFGTLGLVAAVALRGGGGRR